MTIDEDQDSNISENRNSNEEQEPETPQDIWKSPIKDQNTDETNGKKAQ